MGIENLTQLFSDMIEKSPYEIGQTYFFRCVTYHYIGTVVSVGLSEVVLRDAVWVAESGKFRNALEEGTIADAMPYVKGDPVILGRFGIVDATPWRHPLPETR